MTPTELKLAEALMGMVCQHFDYKIDGSALRPGHLSLNEEAADLLVDLGLAEQHGIYIKLLWENLK